MLIIKINVILFIITETNFSTYWLTVLYWCERYCLALRVYSVYLKYLDKYQVSVLHIKEWKKYMSANRFLWTAPTFACLNLSGFLSMGRLKALVYSVTTENEETLHQRVLRPVKPFATVPKQWKYETVHDQMCPCVYWLGWRIFWAFLVNCNLVNNKNCTVIRTGDVYFKCNISFD